MSDPHQPDQPPDEQTAVPLGNLAADDYDRSLERPAPADDTLVVPRDALLAFRKSGGLRFTSRAIVVFRNGWVVPVAESAGAKPRHLSDAALAALTSLVLRSGLARYGKAAAAQQPDRYAYQLAARVGRSLRRVELADGAIPADLAPLVRALSRLLP
jgi:hypothetical protein